MECVTIFVTIYSNIIRTLLTDIRITGSVMSAREKLTVCDVTNFPFCDVTDSLLFRMRSIVLTVTLSGSGTDSLQQAREC